MFGSFRPPSHYTVLYKLHSSLFLTKLILLEKCLVCLVSLPLLDIQIADFLSNLMRGDCYGTTYESFFNNSLFIILKYTRYIPEVHA